MTHKANHHGTETGESGSEARWATSFHMLLEAVSPTPSPMDPQYVCPAWVTLPTSLFLSTTLEPVKGDLGREA